MTSNTSLDQMRGSVLQKMERSERNFKLAFFAGVLIEFFFLIAFLLLADFNNRLHVLLLISTVAIYSIICLGLVALGSHINRGLQRVLQAIDSLQLEA